MKLEFWDGVEEVITLDAEELELPAPLSPGAKLIALGITGAVPASILWMLCRFTPIGGVLRNILNSPFSPTRMLGFTL